MLARLQTLSAQPTKTGGADAPGRLTGGAHGAGMAADRGQWAILIIAALALVTAGASRGEVQPSVTPVSWELTFKPDQLQQITAADRTGRSRTYWYLPYRVINNTGQDVNFLPAVERVSEIDSDLTPEQLSKNPGLAPRVAVDPAIVGVDPSVFRAIKQRHARTYPLLVSPVAAIGKLRQGVDNARDSVAIFPELDPNVSRFTIYFGGLSGERQTLVNPLATAERSAARDSKSAGTGDERVFVVQKTLAMPYTLPGDVNTRRYATPALGKLTWVMR